MKTTQSLSCWQLGLLGLLTSAGIHAFTCRTLAQTTPSNIKPDGTLGAEASQILQNFQGLPIEVIRGGATRGINLFHSFLEFNVSAGRGAYFLSPSADIQNILARVTGANPSNILGTLGTSGNSQPNLFLINPNGIIFGKNASLDVQGSFVGTTANGVQFGNQGNFSATNPQEVPLLTINPSALFVNQINKNGGIINQSQAPAAVNLSGEDVTGLRVPDGKSLLLVGGNVNLDGGGLTASGGRVELAGLFAPGSVGLNVAGDILSLSVPNDVQRSNISLTNGAFVDVTGAGKGDIAINAGNLQMSNSSLFAGIGTGLGDGSTKAGDININADVISLTNGAAIFSLTNGKGDAGNIFIAARDAISLDSGLIINLLPSLEAEGNAGNINITTGSLTATNSAGIGSTISGKGNAGNVTIEAKDAVIFDKESSLLSNVQDGAVGNGGNINITAGSLSLNNSHLDSGVYSNSGTLTANQGKGGTISINVRDTLTISGADSGIFGKLGTGAIGHGGDIKVEAGNVFIKDGGQIISSTFGKGDSGNIFITAKDAISLDGASYILNNVQSGDAVGNAGKIDITTGSFSATNGAQINSLTLGKGNAGNITIQARDAVTFDGKDKNGNQSGLFSVVGNDAVGNGGTVSITSGSLSLNNGGRLGIYVSDASNALQGKKAIGGTANINVRDVFTISGEGSGIFASLGSGVVGTGGDVNIKAGNLFIQDSGEISSFVAAGAEGRGGNFNIQVGNLFIKNGGQINFSTYGKGNAGDISITARDAISLDGAYIYNSVESSDAIGNAGKIDISTGSLKIENSGGIVANTSGQGNGGNITVKAKDSVEILSDGQLDSDVLENAKGNSGNITIQTGRLIVRNSQLSSSVYGEGNAGDFTIIATDSVELSGQVLKREGDTSPDGSVGNPGGIFAQVESLGKGKAGNLTIETKRLSVSDGSKIQAATFGDGNAGNIFIRADEIDLFETEKPNFYNTGIFAGVQTDGRVDAGIIDPRNGRPPVGQGGNLTIETRTLSLRNGASVFVATTGEGDAGKILIHASESVNVTGVSTGTSEIQRASNITAAASQRSTGKGGSLTIETPLLNVADGGFITSSSQGTGTGGDININANIARLNNGKIIAQTAATDGGNINLNVSDYLLLRNGSQISTTAGNQQFGGNGGNININARFIVAIPKENSDISANAFIGAGGNIQINSQGIFGIEARPKLTENSDITASSELGVSGVININVPDTSSIQNSFTGRFPNAIDTNALIAQSCIARGDKRQENTFFITGSGALNPNQPGVMVSLYSTGEVRGVEPYRPWKKGDPIIEPTGVYRLSNGQILLSRECSN